MSIIKAASGFILSGSDGVRGSYLQLQMKQSMTFCLLNVNGNTGTINKVKFLAKILSYESSEKDVESHLFITFNDA